MSVCLNPTNDNTFTNWSAAAPAGKISPTDEAIKRLNFRRVVVTLSKRLGLDATMRIVGALRQIKRGSNRLKAAGLNPICVGEGQSKKYHPNLEREIVLPEQCRRVADFLRKAHKHADTKLPLAEWIGRRSDKAFYEAATKEGWDGREKKRGLKKP